MYITFVSKSLGDVWQWTKPCKTPKQAHIAAENMVSARLLEDRNIPRNFDNYSVNLRKLFPNIILESQEFIGETREVLLPEHKSPKQFQREFHTVQYSPDFEQERIDTEEFRNLKEFGDD
tara:strand:- start:2654 stop:3013 length:360 start_codon:yes stop_codon:yes gene_type:complete